MRKILQISARLPLPLDDGGRIATWNLSRCLHYNGYAIDLVCYTDDDRQLPKWRTDLAEVFASVATVPKNMERQHPTNLLHALATGSSYFVRKFYTRAYAEHVRRLLSENSYDATLIDGAFMGGFLPVLRSAGNAAGKVILRQHNVEYEIFERLAEREQNMAYRLLLRREARLFCLAEKNLVDRVDEVWAITQRDADTFEATGTRRPISVLGPFIDIDHYQIDSHSNIDPHSIVHLGGLSWKPNANGIQWFLEQIWPSVLEQFPDATFHIVGKSPPAWLRNRSDENVIVKGFVDDERPTINRSNIFIVPLHEGSGVRIKILTAMAMGKVSLSTSIGAEGIEWEGLIIRDRPEEWIKAITEQFRQPAQPSRDAAAYIAEHYGWRRHLSI